MTASDTTTKKRRFRNPPRARPGELKAAYASLDGNYPDMAYFYGGYGVGRAHGHLLSEAFEGQKLSNGKSLLQNLRDEGFDISTLRFSVSQFDPRDQDGNAPSDFKGRSND